MNQKKFHLPYLLRLVVFWLFIFAFSRVLFLLFQLDTVSKNGFGEGLKTLVKGFRLDIATASYLIFPAFLLWVMYQIRAFKSIPLINRWLNGILIFLFTLLVVSNIKMYHEWGTLLNYGVFDYILHPGEVLSFISTSQLLLLILFIIGYFLFSLWLYNKTVTGFSDRIQNNLVKYASIIGCLFLLPVMARGGFQLAPINESSAYFSETSLYNHTATNSLWYFIHSYLDRNSNTNPYSFMDDDLAETRYENLFMRRDNVSTSILTTQKPNIVIIILESWTADIIHALGGESDVTPNFDRLTKEGLLFTNIYAAGARTEHGLTSVLSGYPPPPKISIMTIPSKAEKLKSINQILMDNGYSSSFLYGGEIGFANMKTYLIGSHFKTIIDKADFDKSQWNSKWGAHDEFVLDKQRSFLNNTVEPFFSVILTLSTHEPFEVPMKTPFDQSPWEAGKFKQAAYYTDYCLGRYFEKAKKEKWFSNTLFVLVADHGHRLPKYRNLNTPEAKHIPVLFYGDVLKNEVRGTTADITGNQNDIAATLLSQLSQLNQSYTDFPVSKDLLNPSTHSFAYYTTNDVLGWITPDVELSYSYATKKIKSYNFSSLPLLAVDSVILDAKVFLQSHYQHYLDY